MQLEKKELETVNNFIINYKKIYDEITEVENELRRLTIKQKNLLTKLTDNREMEIEFSNQIEEKYGKGKFNILTLEYELNK